MFWESLISIISVLRVCQWMTASRVSCFQHELVIQDVTAHHNLCTMPLSVSMKETVRCFSWRQIKRRNNNSHYCRTLIMKLWHNSRASCFLSPSILQDSPLCDQLMLCNFLFFSRFLLKVNQSWMWSWFISSNQNKVDNRDIYLFIDLPNIEWLIGN